MRVAINGFGRIGRNVFKAGIEKGINFVAINDLTDTKTLAYLLKYDSVYGRYNKTVSAIDGRIRVDGKDIRVLAEKEPAKLPWKRMGIDIVVESTGFFTSAAKARSHLDAGAKRVVITAPAVGDVTTALIGVNDDRFEKPQALTCNASCTTNSVAPVLAILNENIGIAKASMTTIHGYTASQKLVDGPDEKDLRRGRAAAVNIIPSTTGAAEAIIKAIPELENKFDAVAIRVPTINGSLSITTALVIKKTSSGQVNDFFRKASQEQRWSRVLKINEDPIVSSDIIGEPYGAIIDATLTKVVGGDLVEVFSWYDNEAGYTATLVEHVRRIAASL